MRSELPHRCNIPKAPQARPPHRSIPIRPQIPWSANMQKFRRATKPPLSILRIASNP
ncbi:hypothetical protein BofuT4_uP134320.1 [Botrytis cinerea T4]|uniref:Uncharacterized protein n=1 Tax=Botryotinia fuckeliana (strain T4) TaxID=999810 RepID=G2YP39_BOTF4|nr:hypothetical protein BofuT4_uP134320.1 [Botrytis cinerea T4]